MVRDAVRQPSALDDKRTELQEVCHDIAGERDEINRRKLRRWIMRNVGRIVDGQRFVRSSGNRSAEGWQTAAQRAPSDGDSPMQSFDHSDEIRRKRDRRFERHPAQRMRILERSAIEAKP